MNTVLQLDEIKRLISIPELINQIESGFVSLTDGLAKVPPVGFLHFNNPPGDVHIKYGYLLDETYYVVKIASAFYQNPLSGLPSNDGLILVFTQATGQLAFTLLDQGWLTDMRTAAAGAVAARHLAPERVRKIGIVGTGIQARLQLQLLHGIVDCKECLVWGRDKEKCLAMADELRSSSVIREWGITINVVDDIDELASQCRLIVTTTSARSPVLSAENVQKGTHITAMGSDDHGKQELATDLMAKADLIVADSISQCLDHGECCAAIDHGKINKADIVEIGSVIRNPTHGRVNEQQITIADLTGVAVQDIQIANIVALAHQRNNT